MIDYILKFCLSNMKIKCCILFIYLKYVQLNKKSKFDVFD